MKTIIVLPTYNEVGNLEPFTKAVLALEPPVNILIVDDNSPDGTGILADRLQAAAPGRIHVLHRAKKEGLGTAYIAGFRRALALGAERIFEMDADFSHPVEAIPHMVQLSREYDVVVGSRYVAGGGGGFPLAPVATLPQPGRERVRALGYRSPYTRYDLRFSLFPRVRIAAAAPGGYPLPRLCLSDRAASGLPACRLPDRRNTDLLP